MYDLIVFMSINFIDVIIVIFLWIEIFFSQAYYLEKSFLLSFVRLWKPKDNGVMWLSIVDIYTVLAM